MPLPHYLKALTLVIASLSVTGCWHQLKYGPQYVHPPQPSFNALVVKPLTTIYTSNVHTFDTLKVNAALTPSGDEYLQIIQSRKGAGPASVLLKNTAANRRELSQLFQKAYTLLSQAKTQGIQIKHTSLGCIGPKQNEPNCRDNGYAFYPGQMHLAIASTNGPIAYFRAIETTHNRHDLDQLALFNIDELAKMQIALDNAQSTFAALRKQNAQWLVQGAI